MNPETKKLLDESNKVARNAASAAGLNFTPGYNTQTYAPISSTSLAPITPMSLKQPDPLMGADGVLGAMEAQTAQFATQDASMAKDVEQKGTAASKSLQDYLSVALGTQGEAALQDEAGKTLDPIQSELTNINQQILEEQHGLKRQIEALDKQPGTIGQKQQMAYDLSKQSATKQADLSIIQMAVQNRFSDARDIADRKIAVMQEKQKQNLELLKFAYQENKEMFDKAESRQFEAMVRNEERRLDTEKENQKMIMGFSAEAAKMGTAPQMILQDALKAQTPMEALQILGPYLSDPVEKAQALLDMELSKERIKSEASGRSLAEEKFRFEKGMAFEELGLKRAKQAFDMTPGGKVVDAKEYQFKANLFANRLADANTALDGLQSYVVKANPAVFSTQTRAEGTTIGNALVPSEIQQVRQAQRNFINAVLRRESGAVISPSEFAEGNRQYFPRPGDSAGVLQQKAQNRNAVIEALSSEAGPALQRYEMTAKPQTVEYGGKRYSVDAQGNMIPI